MYMWSAKRKLAHIGPRGRGGVAFGHRKTEIARASGTTTADEICPKIQTNNSEREMRNEHEFHQQSGWFVWHCHWCAAAKVQGTPCLPLRERTSRHSQLLPKNFRRNAPRRTRISVRRALVCVALGPQRNRAGIEFRKWQNKYRTSCLRAEGSGRKATSPG